VKRSVSQGANLAIARREVILHSRNQAAARLAQVVKQVDALLAMPPGAEETIEGVHQLRVSTRRFRAVLDTFRDLFPAGARRKIRRSIKRVFAVAGEVRNRDIAAELMDPNDVCTPALRIRLRAEREQQELALRRLLAEWTESSFADRWRAALDLPTVRDAARETLPGYAARLFDSGRLAFAQGDAETLHEFRIAAKKFRYALEMFAPAYGPAFSRRVDTLKKLQDLLGSLNDIETARSLFRNDPYAAAFLAQLAAREAPVREKLERFWRDQMDAPGEAAAWVRYLSRPRAIHPEQ
jgi:CHAD domain-containing protein